MQVIMWVLPHPDPESMPDFDAVCLHRSRSVNYLRCCFDLLSLSLSWPPCGAPSFYHHHFPLHFFSLHSISKAFCLICFSWQLMLLLLFLSLNAHILEFAFIKCDCKSEIYVILGKNFFRSLAAVVLLKRLLFSISFRMKKLCHSNEQICVLLVRCQLFIQVFTILYCCYLIWLPATVDAGLSAINLFVSSNILDRSNLV